MMTMIERPGCRCGRATAQVKVISVVPVPSSSELPGSSSLSSSRRVRLALWLFDSGNFLSLFGISVLGILLEVCTVTHNPDDDDDDDALATVLEREMMDESRQMNWFGLFG